MTASCGVFNCTSWFKVEPYVINLAGIANEASHIFVMRMLSPRIALPSKCWGGKINHDFCPFYIILLNLSGSYSKPIRTAFDTLMAILVALLWCLSIRSGVPFYLTDAFWTAVWTVMTHPCCVGQVQRSVNLLGFRPSNGTKPCFCYIIIITSFFTTIPHQKGYA